MLLAVLLRSRLTGRGLGGTGVADQLAEHQGDPGGRPTVSRGAW